MTIPETDETLEVFDRVVHNLDANFGTAPHKRAAHAKGVVLVGHFTATPDASSLSRAPHFSGARIPVVARFSSFPGGGPHPDAAPECNPRGLAVQFRLPDGSSTDLLAHSIDGFPGRTVDDFADFLAAIAPGGPGPGDYLGSHPAAAAFVAAIQGHGVPSSYAALTYWPVNAFVFHSSGGRETTVRYRWEPTAGDVRFQEDPAELAPDYLTDELGERLREATVAFELTVQLAHPDDVTDDANAHWPDHRRRVTIGRLELTSLVPDSDLAEQALFFDPVRLVDGISLSDDPLLVARTRTYPISLARRHTGG